MTCTNERVFGAVVVCDAARAGLCDATVQTATATRNWGAVLMGETSGGGEVPAVSGARSHRSKDITQNECLNRLHTDDKSKSSLYDGRSACAHLHAERVGPGKRPLQTR
jgi:hypothetical protein